MEVTINYNGQVVAVEVTLEVYEFLDRADHKTENLFQEHRVSMARTLSPVPLPAAPFRFTQKI